MKPKKDKTEKGDSRQQNNNQNMPDKTDKKSAQKDTGTTSHQKVTNRDEQHKITNNDGQEDVENKPVKTTVNDPSPAEKESSKSKIHGTHNDGHI